MLIRLETDIDPEAITRIQHAAFKNHPLHAPGSEPSEPAIVETLRADGQLALSLVAESGGTLVGHLALSPAGVGRERDWLLLGPVGVLPDRQGRGVGSGLVRESMAWARKNGAHGIVLVGDAAFYGRFGFAARHGITYAGVPDRFVLALPFKDTAGGEVEVHPALRAG